MIVMGALPFWETFRKRPAAQAMMRGVDAAVVGLLGAALYNPVWTSSVKVPRDFGIALVGFVLLTVWRAPPLVVVVINALGGIALAHHEVVDRLSQSMARLQRLKAETPDQGNLGRPAP
jgi:chromate transporter